MLIEGVNSGMSDANALKEELAEVLGGLEEDIKDLFLQCLVLPRETLYTGND